MIPNMLATVLAAIALLIIPGAVTAWAGGVRPWAAVASAGPITLGIIGATTWIADALGIPYGLTILAASWAIATAIALIVRLLVPAAMGTSRTRKYNRSFSPEPADWAPLSLLFTLAVTVVGSARMLILLADVNGGSNALRESWDMQWHTNFLRFIRDNGSASPTVAGDLLFQETHAASYYPSAWHGFATLLPGDVFLQANVTSFLAPMLILPAGLVLLVRTIAGRRWAAIAGPVAAVSCLILPEVWDALLITSSMPYLLAVAAIAPATALIMRGHTIPATFALVGTMATHPAAAITVAIFCLLWWITQPSIAAVVKLLVIGALAAGLQAPALFAAAGEGETVAEFFGQIELDRAESFWRTAIGMTTRSEDSYFSVLFLGLAAVGLVVLLLRRNRWTPWPVLAFILLGVASDSAQVRWAEPWGDLLKGISLFYYDMPYRIQAPIGLLRVIFASLAAAAIAAGLQRLLSRRNASAKHSASKRGTSTHHEQTGEAQVLSQQRISLPADADSTRSDSLDLATSPVTASGSKEAEAAYEGAAPAESAQWSQKTLVPIGAALAIALIAASWVSAPATQNSVQASYADRTYFSDTDRQALEWLAQQPEAYDGKILNNYSDGSGWMYAAYNLPSLYRHFSFGDDGAKNSQLVSTNVDLLTPKDASENEYDRAAEKLGINYVFSSPPSVTSDRAEALSQESWAWWTPGLTPIYTDKATTIFAVNRAFSDEQLHQMVANSPHPPMLPANPVLRPPRQPILPPPGETVDPLNGAVVSLSDSEGSVAAINSLLADDYDLDTATPESARHATNDIINRATEILDARGATVVRTDQDTSGETAAKVVLGYSPKGPESRGFSTTAFYAPGIDAAQESRTWQLAAGLRDAFVYHGFSPASAFKKDNSVDKFLLGLSLNTADNARAGAAAQPAAEQQTTVMPPTVAVSLGWAESQKLQEDLQDPAWRGKAAQALADGIASMLRQAPASAPAAESAPDSVAAPPSSAEF